MARARNIKPGFFSNDMLVELPFEYRLLFAGLWTIADREGRLSDRPKKIKLDIFPGDNVDCEAGLQALVGSGFVERYELDGKKYIQVLNWHKHQTPHHKEVISQIPAKPEAKAVESKEEINQEEPSNDADSVDDSTMDHARGIDESCMGQACVIEIASCPTDSLQSDSLNRIPDSLQDQPPSVEPTTSEKRFVAADMDLPVAINPESWLRWCKFRSHKRKPVSKDAAPGQIKLLADYDYATQERIISHSIQNDYQGLFAPKGGSGGQTGQRNSGNQTGPTCPADRVAANIARERAERAAARPGDHPGGMAPDDKVVRPQVDEPIRGSDRPGERMGCVIEGSCERAS